MIGIQNMGYPCTILYESRTNLVKFTSISWSDFSGSMDDIRASSNSIGRISAYTTTITFVIDTQYHPNRWAAGCMERSLLGREHAWGCI
jgi:hypothetical protein